MSLKIFGMIHQMSTAENKQQPPAACPAPVVEVLPHLCLGLGSVGDGPSRFSALGAQRLLRAHDRHRTSNVDFASRPVLPFPLHHSSLSSTTPIIPSTLDLKAIITDISTRSIPLVTIDAITSHRRRRRLAYPPPSLDSSPQHLNNRRTPPQRRTTATS